MRARVVICQFIERPCRTRAGTATYRIAVKFSTKNARYLAAGRNTSCIIQHTTWGLTSLWGCTRNHTKLATNTDRQGSADIEHIDDAQSGIAVCTRVVVVLRNTRSRPVSELIAPMKQNTLDKRWDGWMRCGWRELVGVLGPFWPAIRHEKHEMIVLTTVYARATNVLYRRSQTLEIDRTDIDVHEKIARIKRLCL